MSLESVDFSLPTPAAVRVACINGVALKFVAKSTS